MPLPPKYFESFGGAMEVAEFEPQKFFVHTDHVVVLGHYALNVKGTGKAVETDWVHALTFRGRKIGEFRGYEDSAAIVAAFTKALRSRLGEWAGSTRR